eukprot:6191723-Pleurochrysis_carterae.AAC.4
MPSYACCKTATCNPSSARVVAGAHIGMEALSARRQCAAMPREDRFLPITRRHRRTHNTIQIDAIARMKKLSLSVEQSPSA